MVLSPLEIAFLIDEERSVLKASQDYDTINLSKWLDRYRVQEVIDMSIIMGLIGKDGIILATDSCTTWQNGGFSYHNNDAQKLYQLTNKIGLMTFGYNSGYQHFLADYYNEIYLTELESKKKQLQAEGKLPIDYQAPFLEIVKHFANAVRIETKPFIESYNSLKIAGGINFILAGYDGEKAKIFTVDASEPLTPFTAKSCERYFFGGVSQIGIYWVRKFNMVNYDLPIEFLKKFAIMVILETIKTDDLCGEPIQMALIDKVKGYRNISNEVVDIKTTLDTNNKWIYDYFETIKTNQ